MRWGGRGLIPQPADRRQAWHTLFTWHWCTVRIQWDAKETKLTRNFWIPAMTPEAKPEKVEKPDPNVYCPTSGKRLKIKDLIPVKFTPVDKSKYGTSPRRTLRASQPDRGDAGCGAFLCVSGVGVAGPWRRPWSPRSGGSVPSP